MIPVYIECLRISAERLILETFGKLVDIVFKGVIATAVAVFVAYSTWLKNETDRVKQCDGFYTALIETATGKPATDDMKQSLVYRMQSYGQVCPELKDPQKQYIINLLVPLVVATPPVDKPAPTLTGWLALSRAVINDYADVNFDNLNGSQQFAVGDVIKARWTVNLRKANTPVARGDNPIIGIIDAGSCVKIDQRATGQLNEWAHVSKAECVRPGQS
jgi:hypothetical protein